jgi:hypothetical protein
MKILVFSDSHGTTHAMNGVAAKLAGSVSAIIHLGDFYNDLPDCSGVPVHRVGGNCDAGTCPVEQTVILNDKKIFLTHGHNYGVKYNYNTLCYAALEKGADVCLFGHTHFPEVFKEENILFMNPGSISFPRGIGFASYGIIEICEKCDVIRASAVGLKNGVPSIISFL